MTTPRKPAPAPKGIVFQLTEKELREMVSDFKNYGKSADEERAPTATEMNDARRWAKKFYRERFAEGLMDFLDERSQMMEAQS